MRLAGRCVDGRYVGDGAFRGFQTLDEGSAPFLSFYQGKKRITLATVEYS